MSGPKVVRIVTREEREATARQDIGRFDVVAFELARIGTRFGVWNPDKETAIASKRERMHQLVSKGRFDELHELVVTESKYLEAQIKDIQDSATRKLENARQQRRQLANAAMSIASALKAQGKSVPQALLEVQRTNQNATDAQVIEMRAVLDAALQALDRVVRTAPSTDSDAFASRLAAGAEDRSWNELQPPSGEARERDSRLDHLLARLETLTPNGTDSSFLRRADEITAETNLQRRAVLTDSLILDVSSYVDIEKRRAGAQRELRVVQRSLRAIGFETDALAREIDLALEKGEVTAIEELIKKAREFLSVKTKRKNARARRQAVLAGLAALGYEVRESMSVAWVDSDRIIVKHPTVEDYGIELGASPDAERIQVRVVGAENPLEPRTPKRDRDMEVRWCSDFAVLQRNLANAGTDARLEIGVPAGKEPVASVPMPVSGEVEEGRSELEPRSSQHRK